jgi:phosphoribosylformylglycinamidine synthase II
VTKSPIKDIPTKPADLSKMQRAAPISEAPGATFDALLKRHRISSDEYVTLRKIMGRAPTLAELGVFSAMWSEHCSYKSSRVHLKRFPTKGPQVVVGPGENAGVVRLSGKLCAAFKMESHNHPSYIEPFQGAATGVGGILRDVFCMGARPVANLNCLRFGEREHPRTGWLVTNVVKGIGDYGNCVGIPTVGGNISFDASYNGNCLVNAMTVGLIHEDRIFKGYATGLGNLVVYVGAATGRDGIQGATMASGSFTSDENQERSTVQVGDPFMEKLLLEATLEVLDKNLVIGLQDMGAAGLTSSSFEMAGRAGNGLWIDLNRVPVRTKAMTAYELMLSESQERMLMVIEPSKWDELAAVLERWQLAYGVIGFVTGTGRVEAVFDGRLEIDVPVAPLTDEAPVYKRPVVASSNLTDTGHAWDQKVASAVASVPVAELVEKMLVDTGSKKKIWSQYDQHIGARTVFGPEHEGAAVLWIRSEESRSEPWLGLSISTACNERYTATSARLGAAHAVLRCARMIAASGGQGLAITDCLNFGNPEDPVVMGQFSDSVDGISEACERLGIPVVSGNVSLYNETDGVSIAPTPMIGMVGKIKDVRRAAPAVAGSEGEIFLLHPRKVRSTFGGSLAARVLRLRAADGQSICPPIDWECEKESLAVVEEWIQSGLVTAARDVGAGGVALAAAKMLGTRSSGSARLDFDAAHFEACPAASGNSKWFAEFSGGYLLMTKTGEGATLIQRAAALKFNVLTQLGELVGSGAEIMMGQSRMGLPWLQRAAAEAVPIE